MPIGSSPELKEIIRLERRIDELTAAERQLQLLIELLRDFRPVVLKRSPSSGSLPCDRIGGRAGRTVEARR